MQKSTPSKQRYAGLILLAVLIIGGGIAYAENTALFLRLLLGLALGYCLTRAYTGFAGSVNRAYQAGSTSLMKAMMLMFFISAAGVAGLLVFLPEGVNYDLWINPINLGLLIGGLLFGFGMSLSVCCASGVLTDLISSPPRAGITLIFFMLGVFLGFPLQNTAAFIEKSWFVSTSAGNGVFLPDWFKFDGLNGYLGALILTGLICLLVVYLARLYEKKRKKAGTYTPIDTEDYSIKANMVGTEEHKKYRSLFDTVFVRPWTLTQGAIALSLVFIIMMSATRSGWGASTPYGFWLGQLLHGLGVPNENLIAFTRFPADFNGFAMPFFMHPITIQNLGIVFGTIVYLLFSGNFNKTVRSDLELTLKDAGIYALGGFLMGFGTRLSNGCNVGALYSPIASFSLSGWIFFIVMLVGAILGNIVFRRRKSCSRS